MNAAHWLWVGAGFMSYNEAVRSPYHAEFETEDQFRIAARKIANVARGQALELDERFSSFDAIADFVVERARSSPDRMQPSWWGYEAGIASGLVGRSSDAEYFLRRVTDERISGLAEPLLRLVDRHNAFTSKVNDLVSQERARLGLTALNIQPF